MEQMSDKEEEALNRFGNFVQKNNVSNEFLVQIIEQAGGYLNLMTISAYEKYSGLSYNGVKKTRNIRPIFGVKFVIDNE